MLETPRFPAIQGKADSNNGEEMLLFISLTRKLLVSILLVAFHVTGVWGHAFPLRSEPKVGADISESPTLVRIWFDGPLESVFSEMKLFNAAGNRIDNGKGKVVSIDPTLLALPLQHLGPGKYRVHWEVVSKDGHRTVGDFPFRIQ